MSKTNSGLVTYAKAQIGLPYWYGTFGQTASETLYTAEAAPRPAVLSLGLSLALNILEKILIKISLLLKNEHKKSTYHC